ncbi:MAG TPA: patatin-like phospholipase family protein [Candidatus Limnocylindria bacterium]|jgi:predicted acylesterase/phospholipase RssA|nr:patatin-like phospholipase family protein [Candidatus Limnocylindria bacterium]
MIEDAVPSPRGRRAIVLPGGANRGAYQAGALAGLAVSEGRSTGTPFACDFVGGASSGAINAYLIATARYDRLHEVWRAFAQRHVLRLKPRYGGLAASASPDAKGLARRAAAMVGRTLAGLDLALGMSRYERALADGTSVEKLLDDYVDPDAEVFVPLYVTATNLTRRAGEMFSLRATAVDGHVAQTANDALLRAYDRSRITVVDGFTVRLALFASAALPLVFDPVRIPLETIWERADEYVDGGLTENAPIEAAVACADRLDVVMVDPPQTRAEISYANALEIGVGVYDTLQRIILDGQLRLAFGGIARGTAAPAIRVIRPDRPLPGRYGDFNDLAAIEEMFARGYDDGRRGWSEARNPIPTP